MNSFDFANKVIEEGRQKLARVARSYMKKGEEITAEVVAKHKEKVRKASERGFGLKPKDETTGAG